MTTDTVQGLLYAFPLVVTTNGNFLEGRGGRQGKGVRLLPASGWPFSVICSGKEQKPKKRIYNCCVRCKGLFYVNNTGITRTLFFFLEKLRIEATRVFWRGQNLMATDSFIFLQVHFVFDTRIRTFHESHHVEFTFSLKLTFWKIHAKLGFRTPGWTHDTVTWLKIISRSQNCKHQDQVYTATASRSLKQLFQPTQILLKLHPQSNVSWTTEWTHTVVLGVTPLSWGTITTVSLMLQEKKTFHDKGLTFSLEVWKRCLTEKYVSAYVHNSGVRQLMWRYF